MEDNFPLNQMPDGGWWEGELHGAVGWFPCQYVEKVKM
jgi:hypothetical protein